MHLSENDRETLLKTLNARDPALIQARIPERAGPIASAEAQKAIARIIKDTSEEIARTAVQKSTTTTDRISRRQFIVAAIVGALIAVCLAGAAAWGMYLLLEARGLCAEPPFLTGDGRVGCFIQR